MHKERCEQKSGAVKRNKGMTHEWVRQSRKLSVQMRCWFQNNRFPRGLRRILGVGVPKASLFVCQCLQTPQMPCKHSCPCVENTCHFNLDLSPSLPATQWAVAAKSAHVAILKPVPMPPSRSSPWPRQPCSNLQVTPT